MKATEAPIIVEVTFDKTIDEVWKAITELDQMTQWFFDNIESFVPEKGFKTQFNVSVEDRNFLHQWELIEVIPNKKITYDWRYKEYQGVGWVTFELIESGNRTKLILTNEVKEDFPSNVPEFNRDSCLGGWNYFIKGNLKKYLDDNE